MTLYKAIVVPRPNRVNIFYILLRDGELYLSGNYFLFGPDTKYTRHNLLRVGFTFFSNLTLDEDVHRVMLASHLVNILILMVRVSSELSSHF